MPEIPDEMTKNRRPEDENFDREGTARTVSFDAVTLMKGVLQSMAIRFAVLTALLLSTVLVMNCTRSMAYSGPNQAVIATSTWENDEVDLAAGERVGEPPREQRPPGRSGPQTIKDWCNLRVRELDQMMGQGVPIPIEEKKGIAVYSAYSEVIDPPVNRGLRRKMPRRKPLVPLLELKVAAVLLREHKGTILVALPGDGGQAAPAKTYHNVTITAIPHESVQVLQVRPGEAKILDKVKRVPGGTQITVPEFDADTTILCTTDSDLFDRVRVAAERRAGQPKPR